MDDWAQRARRHSSAANAALTSTERLLHALVRRLRQLGGAGAVAVLPLAGLFGRDGFDEGDLVLTVLLLVPAAVLLLFAQGVGEVASFPERVRRVPGEGQERAVELARLGGELRGARLRRLPVVLWRLRGTIGSVRGIAGIALPLRVFTPWFLTAAALSAFACVGLVCAGAVALVVLALG